MTGVKLNFFLGWPIGPAKIWFGWPAISLAGPRYFIGFGQPIIITIPYQQKLKVNTFSLFKFFTKLKNITKLILQMCCSS